MCGGDLLEILARMTVQMLLVGSEHHSVRVEEEGLGNDRVQLLELQQHRQNPFLVARQNSFTRSGHFERKLHIGNAELDPHGHFIRDAL